jgi:hypothetical protein
MSDSENDIVDDSELASIFQNPNPNSEEMDQGEQPVETLQSNPGAEVEVDDQPARTPVVGNDQSSGLRGVLSSVMGSSTGMNSSFTKLGGITLPATKGGTGRASDKTTPPAGKARKSTRQRSKSGKAATSPRTDDNNAVMTSPRTAPAAAASPRTAPAAAASPRTDDAVMTLAGDPPPATKRKRRSGTNGDDDSTRATSSVKRASGPSISLKSAGKSPRDIATAAAMKEIAAMRNEYNVQNAAIAKSTIARADSESRRKVYRSNISADAATISAENSEMEAIQGKIKRLSLAKFNREQSDSNAAATQIKMKQRFTEALQSASAKAKALATQLAAEVEEENSLVETSDRSTSDRDALSKALQYTRNRYEEISENRDDGVDSSDDDPFANTLVNDASEVSSFLGMFDVDDEDDAMLRGAVKDNADFFPQILAQASASQKPDAIKRAADAMIGTFRNRKHGILAAAVGTALMQVMKSDYLTDVVSDDEYKIPLPQSVIDAFNAWADSHHGNQVQPEDYLGDTLPVACTLSVGFTSHNAEGNTGASGRARMSLKYAIGVSDAIDTANSLSQPSGGSVSGPVEVGTHTPSPFSTLMSALSDLPTWAKRIAPDNDTFEHSS